MNFLWSAGLIANLAGLLLGLAAISRVQSHLHRSNICARAYLRARFTHRAEGPNAYEHVNLHVLQLSFGLFVVGLFIYVIEADARFFSCTIAAIGGWVYLSLMYPSLSYRFSFSNRGSAELKVSSAPPEETASAPPIEAPMMFFSLARADRDFDEQEALDLEILVSMYAERLEDSLLYVLWDALRDHDAVPEMYLRLVDKLFTTVYRSHPSKAAGKAVQPNPLSPDNLSSLPPHVYATLLELVAENLSDELFRQAATNDTKAIQWSRWMRDLLRIVLAYSPHPLPAYTSSILIKFMTTTRSETFWTVVLHSQHSEPRSGPIPIESAPVVFASALEKFKDAFDLLPGDVMSFNLATLFVACFCRHEAPTFHHGYQLSPLVLQHRTATLTDSLAAMGKYIAVRLTNEVKPEMFWHSWIIDLAQASMLILDSLPANSVERYSLDAQVRSFARAMLVQPKNCAILMRYASGDNEDPYAATGCRLFVDIVVAANTDVTVIILQYLNAAMRFQVNNLSNPPDTWATFIRLHPLRTCVIVLQALQQKKRAGALPVLHGGDGETALRAVLAALWSTISQWLPLRAIRPPTASQPPISTGDQTDTASNTTQTTVTYPPMDPQLALQSLLEIVHLEELGGLATASDEEFDAWARQYNPETSYFTDSLIRTLSDVVADPAVGAIPRVRRLLWVSAQAQPVHVTLPTGTSVPSEAKSNGVDPSTEASET